MGGAGRKIHIQLFDINGHVRGALGAVQHHHSAHRVGPCHDLFHRGTQAQHVGHHADGDQFGLGSDLFVQLLGGQVAVRAGVEVHELGTRCFRHPLPGHQIGVVLGHRDHDFVALMQEMQAITIGHQIQGFGGVLGEDDLIILGPKEPRHPVAGSFVGVGGTHGQLIHAPVGVGIVFLVVVQHGIQHLLGVLGGGGAVQIDQPIAVFVSGQNGEIFHPRIVLCGQHVSSSLLAASARTSSRRASSGIFSMAGAKRASTIRRRAWASFRPRERR